MLDQLVESRNTRGENTRRSGFLLTTFVIMTSILVGAWMYSLFAKDYALGAGDLELSTLVAPVPVAEDEPPPPPEVKPEKIVKAAPNADVLVELRWGICGTFVYKTSKSPTLSAFDEKEFKT